MSQAEAAKFVRQLTGHDDHRSLEHFVADMQADRAERRLILERLSAHVLFAERHHGRLSKCSSMIWRPTSRSARRQPSSLSTIRNNVRIRPALRLDLNRVNAPCGSSGFIIRAWRNRCNAISTTPSIQTPDLDALECLLKSAEWRHRRQFAPLNSDGRRGQEPMILPRQSCHLPYPELRRSCHSQRPRQRCQRKSAKSRGWPLIGHCRPAERNTPGEGQSQNRLWPPGYALGKRVDDDQRCNADHDRCLRQLHGMPRPIRHKLPKTATPAATTQYPRQWSALVRSTIRSMPIHTCRLRRIRHPHCHCAKQKQHHHLCHLSAVLGG